MKAFRLAFVLAAVVALPLAISACSPKVGSPEWCQMMKDTPKGDWTASDAAEFAKSCVL